MRFRKYDVRSFDQILRSLSGWELFRTTSYKDNRDTFSSVIRCNEPKSIGWLFQLTWEKNRRLFFGFWKSSCNSFQKPILITWFFFIRICTRTGYRIFRRKQVLLFKISFFSYFSRYPRYISFFFFSLSVNSSSFSIHIELRFLKFPTSHSIFSHVLFPFPKTL